MKPDVFYFYMFPSKSIHFRGFFFLGRITIKGGRIPPKTGHGKGHPKIEGGCPPPPSPYSDKGQTLTKQKPSGNSQPPITTGPNGDRKKILNPQFILRARTIFRGGPQPP